MGEETTDPRVLVVDDEQEVADGYAIRMTGIADVETAYDGEAALATIDETDPPDVVLLDRRMPGLSGDEVLTAIRESDARTRVVMITAIDPDFTILEMPFDDYLCKPVGGDDLRTAVEYQFRVLAYELLGEYFRLEAKLAVLEPEVPPEARDDHDELVDLERRTARLGARIERLLPGEEADEVFDRFATVGRASP